MNEPGDGESVGEQEKGPHRDDGTERRATERRATERRAADPAALPRTKIVATLGPSSADAETVAALIDAGLSVARLNFSHGRRQDHMALMETVRQVASSRRRHVALLADLQGPRMRLGDVVPQTQLAEGATFVLDGLDVPGDDTRARMSFVAPAAAALSPGERVLVADGAIELRVVEATPETIVTTVVHGGPISSQKGVNLPDTLLDLPPLTAKDEEDLAFALEQEVDFVALSFVSCADDVRLLKAKIAHHGADVPVIAKVERPRAVEDIEEIIATADGVMVARGDLALEVGAATVPLIQKRIIRLCHAAGVPVITATQMLDSMIRHATPTRAETSDVANAILDGTDAVMLSGETAVGRYPERAVREMCVIARETEPAAAFGVAPVEDTVRPRSVAAAVGEAAVSVAARLEVAAIAAATTTGSSARITARCRPAMTLVGIATEARVCRRMSLVWGVDPVLVEPYDETEAMVRTAGEALLARGAAADGDRFVVVSGQPIGTPGSTNMVQVRRVGDWR